MSMVRAMRLLNSVEAGITDAAALQTLLADAGRLSEWSAMLSMRGQVQRILSSTVTLAAVCGSPRALGALMQQPKAAQVFYSPDFLPIVAPSAWAVYAPLASMFEVSGAAQVARWRNALGVTLRDAVQATGANRPVLSGLNPPGAGVLSTPLFDGADDILTVGEAFNQPTAYTVFVVYRREASTAHYFLDASNGNRLGAQSTANATYGTGSNNNFSNSAAAAGVWALGRYRRESAALLYHSLNGGADSTAVTTNIPPFDDSPRIGNALSGRIAEMWLLAGNGGASSPEVQRVTALLKNKYGL